MPGFSLLFDRRGEADSAAASMTRALERMRHHDDYRAHSILADRFFRLGWTGNGSYPVQAWPVESGAALFEGFIYSPELNHPRDLTSAITTNTGSWVERAGCLRQWQATADGDFALVLVATSPSPGVIVALDPLGRLPVYWYRDGDRLLVSREVKFITALMRSVRPDRTGIAQMLALGFPWGNRTLLDSVHRLPPGAILTWVPDRVPSLSISTFPWSFPDKGRSGDAPCGFVEELVDDFIAGTRRRVEAFQRRPLVLSLSGGMDSRAVAAAMAHLNTTAQARTSFYPPAYGERESASARQVAAVCGLPWRLVTLVPPSPDACDDLVHLKDGLNSAEMATADEYLSGIVADHGPDTVLFSGAGGGLTLVPRHPGRPVTSTRALAELILAREMMFHPDLLESALGIARETLRDDLASVLDAYPETDMPGKYLRFCLSGHEVRYGFEGEDRNRAYLWVAAPYYARPFFDHVMAAPHGWKRRGLLQCRFLRTLSAEVAAVRNANTGLVPGGLRDRFRQRARELVLASTLWEAIVRNRRRRRQVGRLPADLHMRLVEAARSSPLVGEVFRRDRLLDWIEHRSRLPQAWPLYTVVRYLSSFESP